MDQNLDNGWVQSPNQGMAQNLDQGRVQNLDQGEESFSGNSSCLVGNVSPNLVQTPFLPEELVDRNCIRRESSG